MSLQIASDSSCGKFDSDVGIPHMTFICSSVSADSIVISGDSKVSWTDGRKDEIHDKVFPVNNFALAISGHYWVATYLKDYVVTRAGTISSNIFDAAHEISRFLYDAFAARYKDFASKEYSTDIAVYGWGDLAQRRTMLQCEFKSIHGFPPHPHTNGVFAIGKPLHETGVADHILSFKSTWAESDLAEVMYYTVERTIRRAPKLVGHPIRTFALSDGATLREIVVQANVVSKYDTALSKGFI